jgi:hypothetical protein
MAELLTRQVNTSWSEEEYEQLCALAQEQSVPVARLVREMARERLEQEADRPVQMSRSEQVLLIAIRELHSVYLAAMNSSVRKELTQTKLEEIANGARLQRRDLLTAYLGEMWALPLIWCKLMAPFGQRCRRGPGKEGFWLSIAGDQRDHTFVV